MIFAKIGVELKNILDGINILIAGITRFGSRGLRVIDSVGRYFGHCVIGNNVNRKQL